MFSWRDAIVLGIVFVVVGVAYLLLQGNGEWSSIDAGATMLIVLGSAMAFVFAVLLRGSREL